MSVNKMLSYIFPCLMTILSSCNPGIFIEHLETSETEYYLPFTGGTAEIELSHGNWEIERVSVNNVDIEYDTDGQGFMTYKSRFLSFNLSRPTSSKLILNLEMSVDPDPVSIDIHISNDFQSATIPITINACKGYTFERIEYGAATEVVAAVEEAWVRTLETAVVMDWESYVFDDSFRRTVTFLASSVSSDDMPEVMWMSELLKYVGEAFDVPLPEPFPELGKTPGLQDTVQFSYKETVLPLAKPSDKVRLSLGPGVTTVHMDWGYVQYRIPYTIWLSHPEGKALSFSGELISKTYDGRWEVRQ